MLLHRGDEKRLLWLTKGQKADTGDWRVVLVLHLEDEKEAGRKRAREERHTLESFAE